MSQSGRCRVHWSATESGLVVPAGVFRDVTNYSADSFSDLKHKADRVERVFTLAGVTIPPSSCMAKMLADLRSLPGGGIVLPDTPGTHTLNSRAYTLARVADVLLLLEGLSGAERILTELLDGSLDLSDGKQSKAKDSFWEVELFGLFREFGFAADLVDPPDIVLEVGSSVVGVACKKVYSEKRVQSSLSNAIRQVQPTFDIGIVALNIDDLVLGPACLEAASLEAAGDLVRKKIAEFLSRKERFFTKYLSEGRAAAVIVSATVHARVEIGSTKYHRVNEMIVWNIEGLPKAKHELLSCVLERFGE